MLKVIQKMIDSTSNPSRSFLHIAVFDSMEIFFIILILIFFFFFAQYQPIHSVTCDVYINISLHSACSPQIHRQPKTHVHSEMNKMNCKNRNRFIETICVKFIESVVRRFLDCSLSLFPEVLYSYSQCYSSIQRSPQ